MLVDLLLVVGVVQDIMQMEHSVLVGLVALAVAPLLITDKEMEMRQPQIQVVVEAVE